MLVERRKPLSSCWRYSPLRIVHGLPLVRPLYTSHHRIRRTRLSRERIVDVVLLRKEVTLDLSVLEELKVTLCSTR